MPEILLTDLDGTLVDSNALHADAWRRTLEHFGIQIGLDEAWRQIGKGGDKVIPIFVPESDVARLEQPIKDFRKELFTVTICRGWLPLPKRTNYCSEFDKLE